MLRTRSLWFAYDDSNGFEFPDIELKENEDLLIIGESGIGKTTLLHLLAGLLRPNSGNVEIGELDIFQLSPRKLDKFRGQHIGIVFQNAHFISALTLRENLLMVQKLAGKPQSADSCDELLSHLGLGKKSGELPSRLSEGEKQRASIAMALINKPSILLADEPTSSLDDKNCQRVADLLKEQARETGAHLIVITHDNRLKPMFQNQLEL